MPRKEAELINEVEFLKNTLDNISQAGEKNQAYEALINSKDYKETTDALAELSKISKDYFTLNEDGEYAKADNNTIKNMLKQYDRLYSSLKTLLSPDNKKKIFKEINKTGLVEQTLFLLEHTQELVIKDANALRNINTDEPVELPKLIVECRSRKYEINGDTTISGGSLSERIPISFTDKEGKTRNGFFTKDEYINYKDTLKTVLNDKLMDHLEKNSYNDIIRSGIHKLTKLINDPAIVESPSVLHHTLINMGVILKKNGNDPVLINAFKKRYGKNSSKSPIIFKKSDEYNNFIACLPQKSNEFMIKLNRVGQSVATSKACRKIFRFDTSTVHIIKQSYGSSIPQRNSAMSAVAQMLGVGKIIAHSENMTVKINGKQYSGVFMENAEGKDLRLAKKEAGDPFYDLCKRESDALRNRKNPELFDDKSLIRDINDLHILDYICNNVDRHGHNFLYKFSKDGKKIVGIQGIDNDNSFGTTVYDPLVKPDMKNHALILRNIKYINKSMFETLDKLDKNILELTLKGFALSSKERNAVLERVDQVKEAVNSGILKVMDEAALKTKTIHSIAMETKRIGKDNINIFNRFDILTNTIRDEMAEERQSAPTKFTSGKMTKLSERLSQLNKLKVEEDASFFKTLSKRMKATDSKVSFGSKAFERLEASIDALKKDALSVRRKMNRSVLGVDAYNLSAYKEALSDVIDKATKYLSTKPKTSKGMAPAPKERFDTAKEALKHAKERLNGINEALKDRRDMINAENRISFSSIKSEQEKLHSELKNNFDEKKYFKWLVLDEIVERGEKAFDEVSFSKEDLRTAIKSVSNDKYIKKALSLFEGLCPKATSLKDAANKCKSAEDFINSIKDMPVDQAKTAYSEIISKVPSDNLDELSGGKLKNKIILKLELEKLNALKDSRPEINFENPQNQNPQL